MCLAVLHRKGEMLAKEDAENKIVPSQDLMEDFNAAALRWWNVAYACEMKFAVRLYSISKGRLCKLLGRKGKKVYPVWRPFARLKRMCSLCTWHSLASVASTLDAVCRCWKLLKGNPVQKGVG
jgi:hypothetical protein